MRPPPAPSGHATNTDLWRAIGDASEHRIEFADHAVGCRALVDHPRPVQVATGHASDHHHLDRFAARSDATATALAAATTAHHSGAAAPPPVLAASAGSVRRWQRVAAVLAVALAVVVRDLAAGA